MACPRSLCCRLTWQKERNCEVGPRILLRQTLERNGHFHQRPRIGIFQTQLTTKFLDSLAHSSEAHSDAVGAELCHARFHTFSVVTYGDNQLIVRLLERDPA